MGKGIIASILGLIAISLVGLAFVLTQPTQFSQNNEKIFTFSDKILEKQQRIKYLADQAITESLADTVRENISTPGCTLSADLLDKIRQKTEGQNGYLEKINNLAIFPENKFCQTKKLTDNFPSGLSANTVVYSITTNTKCSAETITINPDTSQEQTQEFLSIQKKHTLTKKIITREISGQCNIRIIDLDSYNEFIQ